MAYHKGVKQARAVWLQMRQREAETLQQREQQKSSIYGEEMASRTIRSNDAVVTIPLGRLFYSPQLADTVVLFSNICDNPAHLTQTVKRSSELAMKEVPSYLLQSTQEL